MPDKPLSKQNGTKTSCDSVVLNGGSLTAPRPDALEYVQMPFKLFH